MPYNQQGLYVKGKNRVALDGDGLNLHPVNITPDVWYYEDNKGISVYWQGEGLIATIPWRNLRASLKHKDAAHD